MTSPGAIGALERTVLVVEDDPQAAELMTLYLGRAGYQVTLAGGGGDEVVQMAREQHPIAIALDPMRRGGNGWEVLTRLKGIPQTRHIPVVIVSVPDRPVSAHPRGGAEFRNRPIDCDALLHALADAREGAVVPPRRILLVHTNPEQLHDLALSMQAHDYEVIEALGSEAAACLARRVSPDLVVVDPVAGGVDCSNLVSALKADTDTARIPILALTVQRQADRAEERRVRFMLIRDETIEPPLFSAITLLLSEGQAEPATETTDT